MATAVDNMTEIIPEKLGALKVSEHEIINDEVSMEMIDDTCNTETNGPDCDDTTSYHSHHDHHDHHYGHRKGHRHSRRSSSFTSVHRNKISVELTTKAESHFVSLIELLSCASREASSVKEFWQKIIVERESFYREYEELEEQIEELCDQLEKCRKEKDKHCHESDERKRIVEKLRIELSIAISNISIEREKVIVKERELEKVCQELRESEERYTHTRTEFQRIRQELESLRVCFKEVESERDCARQDAEKHERELSRVIREKIEISSSLVEMTSKFEHHRREVLLLTERIKVYESEREEHLHECDRLREDCRKAKCRAEECSKELLELTEKYERVHREITKHKETIRVIESERDELFHTVEHQRREIKTIIISRDEAIEACSEVTLKWEHCKRELCTVKETLRELEVEHKETLELVEKTRQQHKLIIIERDQLKEDLHCSEKRADEFHRKIVILEESLRKSEFTLTEVRSELSITLERCKSLERKCEESNSRNEVLCVEITKLKETITVLRAEIHTHTESHSRLRHELEKSRRECQELRDTVSRCHDDNHELECEVDNLRMLLREAQGQRERAITARNSADRERDEYITKYEEKCREMERFEEGSGSHHHHHSHILNGRPESRTSRSRQASRSRITIQKSNGILPGVSESNGY